MKDIVLLTGATGYLGIYVLRELMDRGLKVLTAGRRDSDLGMELADLAEVERVIRDLGPRWILNVGAMSAINDCMERPELAAVVNAQAPQLMARVAPGRLLQVSTDLVFDGHEAPYDHLAEARPLSVYGMTKSEGEKLAGVSTLVARVPLLFGPSPDLMRGATDMLRRAVQSQSPITLFSNEYRTPMHVADAARGLVDLMLEDSLTGVRHLAGTERVSRYDLARRFAQIAELPVELFRAGESDDPRRPRDVSMVADWQPERLLDEALAES